MGWSYSTPSKPSQPSRSSTPPPPPSPFTPSPWRHPSNWNAELAEKITDAIKKLDPKKRPNLLTIGPVGAGKSSFISSILSIGKERKYGNVPTGSSASSYTLTFDLYTDNTLLKKYRLRDCMGIEPSDEHGFHPEDIIALLKGHVREKYKFNPAHPITSDDPCYRSDPQINNQTHCVIFVLSAKSAHAGISREYVQKIKNLQDKIKRERIPRIVVLTQADLLCEEVKRNVNNMFRSVKVQNAVKIISEVFGIDKASIHPVVNYEENADITPEQNIPLLLAIKQSMDYADDRMEQLCRPSEDSD